VFPEPVARPGATFGRESEGTGPNPVRLAEMTPDPGLTEWKGEWATNCPRCNGPWTKAGQGLSPGPEAKPQGGTVMCPKGHQFAFSEERQVASQSGPISEYLLWDDVTPPDVED
jgi:hypothetical protein